MTGPARDQGAGRPLACGPGARRLSSGPDDVPSWLSSHDGMMATRSWMEAPVTTYEIRVIGSFGPAAREAFGLAQQDRPDPVICGYSRGVLAGYLPAQLAAVSAACSSGSPSTVSVTSMLPRVATEYGQRS